MFALFIIMILRCARARADRPNWSGQKLGFGSKLASNWELIQSWDQLGLGWPLPVVK